MMNCTFYILNIIYTKANNAAKANILKCIHYIALSLYIYIAKSIGSPPSNENFDFSNFYEAHKHTIP